MGFVNLRLATTALLDQPECSFASVSGRAGSRQAAQPGSGCSQRAATMLQVGALKRRSTATRGPCVPPTRRLLLVQLRHQCALCTGDLARRGPATKQAQHPSYVLQADQVKVIAQKVCAKYYSDPMKENARWARRHAAMQDPSQGLPKQEMPATLLSMDFKPAWWSDRWAELGCEGWGSGVPK